MSLRSKRSAIVVSPERFLFFLQSSVFAYTLCTDVAVCGLPEPRKDHAVSMARAAARYVYKMSVLTKRLEVELGPDTGDLNVRIGLHSGAVTAGVLRGERSRFQVCL